MRFPPHLPSLSPLCLSLGLSALLCGCADLAQPTARADLLDPAGQVTGKATFMPEVGGTRVLIEVSGLKPGQHGLHIHVNPSCERGPDPEGKIIDFGGAGGHFDPEKTGNHDHPEAPNRKGHAGDLPMLDVGADGTGRANFKTNKVKVSGPEGVLGHSIVIHAQPDDYQTDPSGKTGARERCGIFK